MAHDFTAAGSIGEIQPYMYEPEVEEDVQPPAPDPRSGQLVTQW